MHIRKAGVVLLVISLLNVFYILPAEAIVKPIISAKTSSASVAQNKKITITATATYKGLPVDSIRIYFGKKILECTKVKTCVKQLGPFWVAHDYKASYIVEAVKIVNNKRVVTRVTKYFTILLKKDLPANTVSTSTPSVTSSTTSSDNRSITSTVAQPNTFGGDMVKSRDSKRLSDLRQLQTALELFYTDTDKYPSGNGTILGLDSTSCLNSDGWNSYLDCPYPYMGRVPSDNMFGYTYTSSGNSYYIDTSLESESNGLSGKIRMTPSGISNL